MSPHRVTLLPLTPSVPCGQTDLQKFVIYQKTNPLQPFDKLIHRVPCPQGTL